MTDSTAESILTTTTGLLTYYCYEAESQAQDSLLDRWLGDYSPEWVRLALIESLYRGRYKTISVGGLLADWKRKGQPLYHFNREFEALICHKFPQIKFNQADTSVDSQTKLQPPVLSKRQTPHLKSTIAATEVNKVLNQPEADFLMERNLQRSEPDMGSSLDEDRTPMSHKLWSFVAEVSGNKSLTSGHSHPSSPGKGFNAPSGKSVWDKIPQKTEVAPIDQFIPNQEVPEHYQKLVGLVSNRTTH
ncbi:hypothetical protein [Acaryochloris marina]|uniref:DnaD domain-containing protein n=1 Tax=Acaryochloris marina (strain MBIC 11017) TaxID=329726 RepID=B0C8K6_ACAM1|nr:hypothetical protein [Acaryochloris marina]ABW30161.1 conserved hypothetical protein [Acaryochloris marina MBIC11017]BDM79007.1 hypothetical protein AM10699_18750 [Acaryochloris marina MBIC10699]